MNLQQLKKDMSEGVILSRSTFVELINYAIALSVGNSQAATIVEGMEVTAVNGFYRGADITAAIQAAAKKIRALPYPGQLTGPALAEGLKTAPATLGTHINPLGQRAPVLPFSIEHGYGAVLYAHRGGGIFDGTPNYIDEVLPRFNPELLGVGDTEIGAVKAVMHIAAEGEFYKRGDVLTLFGNQP